MLGITAPFVGEECEGGAMNIIASELKYRTKFKTEEKWPKILN